jgi:hypothetical protein
LFYRIIDGTANNPPTGQITLTVTDLFGASFTTRPINIDSADDSADIQSALQALPNSMFESVTVTAESTLKAGGTVDGYIYLVQYPNLPHNHGVQNLIEVNIGGCNRAGCTPLYTGLTDASNENGISTLVEDVTGLVHCAGGSCHKESAECSEHGLCDRNAGICECFPGFIGNACEEQLPIA